MTEYNAQVKRTTASGAAVYADSNPIPIQDTNGRDGWLFQKTVAGTSKFNYYVWAQGNQPLTLSDIHNIFFTGSVDSYSNGASVPFIVVYTKLQASGNAGSFYHSSISYSMINTETILLGETVQFHTHGRPDSKLGYRPVPLNDKIVNGDGLPSEEIYAISIHSDSGAAINTSILITDCGFTSNSKNLRFVLRLDGKP